jgi:hypothetical protein
MTLELVMDHPAHLDCHVVVATLIVKGDPHQIINRQVR